MVFFLNLICDVIENRNCCNVIGGELANEMRWLLVSWLLPQLVVIVV